MDVLKKVLKGISNFWHKGGIPKIIIIVACLAVVLGINTVKNNISDSLEKNEEHSKEYDWPKSGLAKMLPKPETKNGEIVFDNENHFEIVLFDGDEDEYKDYVKSCKKKGFEVDYQNTNLLDTKNYYAKNKDDYSLSIEYYEEDGYYDKDSINISLSAPVKPTEQTPTTEQPAATDDTNDTSSTSSDMIDGMRKSFKDTMDSYESFFNKYVEFMKTYQSSTDQLSMLSDYTDMMSQYQDAMTKMTALDDGNLNSKELSYYSEVTLRINQKLTEVVVQ